MDEKYLSKFLRHFSALKNMRGLSKSQFVIFCLGVPPTNEIFRPLWDLENLDLIGWMPPRPKLPPMNNREFAFSTFVFGVAQHIKTPYWMKLDGDARPVAPKLIWPDYTGHTITGDAWWYTKVKGDDTKVHWLNTLDDWWKEKTGQPPLFQKIDGRYYKHNRLRSYCWIEKLEFTKKLAELCGHRLPIPSHDTTAWYVATRLGEPMQAYPFRKYIIA